MFSWNNRQSYYVTNCIKREHPPHLPFIKRRELRDELSYFTISSLENE